MDVGKLSSSKRRSFIDRLKDSTYRHALVASYIKNGIAFQIRSMRKAAGWDQKTLAEKALGNADLQSMISRYENPDYGKYSLRTLLDFAKTFDVALQVRFVPFSELVRFDQEMPNSNLAVPSFSAELSHGHLSEVAQSNTASVVPMVRVAAALPSENFYRPEQTICASFVEHSAFPEGLLTMSYTEVRYAIQ
jgi:transcriptional regulator with XRE-family HTH domain